MTPLTHHEILGHVGPFAQTGRHVDLARSDRAGRLLIFKPVVHAAIDSAVAVPLTETLQLDLSRPAARLVRTLSAGDGLQATLDARNTDLATLLESVLGVSPATHFRVVEGLLIADSFRCPDDRQRPLKLQESRARLPGIDVVLDARTVVGEPMSVRLIPHQSHPRPAFPEDVVAVLGLPFKLLQHYENHAKFLLQAPAKEPKRSMVAQARFAQVAAHLTRVLDDAPEHFHNTYRAARWRVWLRRLTPLAIAVSLVASLPLIKHYFMTENLSMNPLIFGVPNFLILVFVYLSRHEIPTIEFPPLPRPLLPDAWPCQQADTTTPSIQTMSDYHG
ncbi:MAG: hypothetical protein AAFO81_12105 [Pseudomonadota bacterium]